MATKRTVSFRVQDELINRIKAEAKATGRSTTSLVIEALSQVFDLSQPYSAPITTNALPQQLERLEEQIKELSEQLAELPQQLRNLEDQIKELSEQLVELPQQIKSLEE